MEGVSGQMDTSIHPGVTIIMSLPVDSKLAVVSKPSLELPSGYLFSIIYGDASLTFLCLCRRQNTMLNGIFAMRVAHELSEMETVLSN